MAIANRKLKRRASNDAIGQVTVSAGLAQRKLGETPQAFIGRADKALYASKRTGRNKTTNAEAVPIRPLPHTQKAWAKNP
jgi:diguanylate cyclase